jgi:hypothetical protein
MVKVGGVQGVCGNCGKTLYRPRPATVADCDCWEYCPRDHGNGRYATKMAAYSPDLTPNTYGPLSGEEGDVDHPMDIVMRCPVCGYLSATKPQQVRLT